VGSIASRVGAKSGLYLKRYFGVKKAILTVGFFERSYHPNIAGSRFPLSINYEDKNTKISATYLIVFRLLPRAHLWFNVGIQPVASQIKSRMGSRAKRKALCDKVKLLYIHID